MEKKKKIAISVTCLILAGAVFLIFNNPFRSSGISTGKGTLQMLCVNEKCGAAFEITRKEHNQQLHEKVLQRGPAGGQPAFTCPECGQESTYIATKCKECGAVFVPDYGSDDYFDRCPKCGYSDIEQELGKQKK